MMNNDKVERITSESIRMFHAVCAGAGKELATKMFPHVARHLARLDAGVTNMGQWEDTDD
jgi:hypothetical protein